MDRLSQDLHTALHNDLSFRVRMQIAQDVVQGIRFLHAQVRNTNTNVNVTNNLYYL